MTILSDLNVVEISASGAAGVGAKAYADWGATVTILEPAEGTPLRHQHPVYQVNGQDRSGRWEWLSRGKTAVKVGPGTKTSQADAVAFCKAADVVILESELSEAVLGLKPTEVEAALKGTTVVLVTPFGLGGPYESYRATDLGFNALGGWTVGDPTREPLRPGGDVLHRVAGMWAFSGSLIALRHLRQGGEPQFIDVPMQAIAAYSVTAQWLFSYPTGNAGARSNPFPSGALLCKDGIMGVSPLTNVHHEMLFRMLGMDDIIEAGNVNPEYQAEHADELSARAQPFFDERTRNEIMHEAQSWRLPAAPFETVADRLECEQLNARGYFETAEIDGVQTKMPRVPYLIDNADPVKRGPVVESDTLPDIGQSPPRTVTERHDKPFEGLRVIDLTWFWSGPSAMKLMGALGADVIKVESIQRPDSFRFNATSPAYGDRWIEMSGLWLDTNNNKRDITLDLAQPEGMEFLVRLIKGADIVISNYSNRVMPNLGLTNPELLKINPNLITVVMPGYGPGGPWEEFVGYGISFEQLCACAMQTGYSDALPMVMGGFSDPLVGIHTVAAIELALRRREATGQGADVEVPQSETLDSIWGPEHIAVQHGWEMPGLLGNHHPQMAPHNIYAAKGEGQWASVAIENDAQWAIFAKAIGLGNEKRFATFEGRKANESLLDQAVAAALATHDARELEGQMQAKGVPVTHVVRAPMLNTDENLQAWGFFQKMDRQWSGETEHRTFPIRFSDISTQHVRPCPGLGEHTAEVLAEIAQPGDPTIEELEAKHISGTVPLMLL